MAEISRIDGEGERRSTKKREGVGGGNECGEKGENLNRNGEIAMGLHGGPLHCPAQYLCTVQCCEMFRCGGVGLSVGQIWLSRTKMKQKSLHRTKEGFRNQKTKCSRYNFVDL